MIRYSFYSIRMNKAISAASIGEVAEIVAWANGRKLWIYRHSDGSWWSTEKDIFGNDIIALTSKRKVPAEYRQMQGIFN
jgi:hypothetical protein